MPNNLKNGSRSTLINSCFSVLDALFAPIVVMITTPIFIRHLGIEGYGLWILATSLGFVMSLVNIGGVDTLLRYIPLNRNNGKDYINELFISLTILQVILIVIGCVLACVIVIKIPIDKLFKIDSNDINSYRVGIMMGLGIFSLKIIEQMALAYYKGYERYDLSTFCSFMCKLLVIAVQIITVQLDMGVQYLLQHTFVAMLISVSLNFYFLNKIVGISFWRNVKLKNLNVMIHHMRWSWLNSLTGPISGQIDKWIIAALGNAVALSMYHIAISIFEMIISLLSAAVNWLYPKSASNGNALNIGTYKYYTRVGLLLLAAGLVTSFSLINLNFIFVLWLGADTYAQASSNIENMLLFIPLYCIGMVPYFLIKGYGLIRHVFYAEILNSIVKFTAISLLFNFFNVEAMIVAYGVCGVFLSWYYIRILNSHVLLNSANSAVNFYFCVSVPVLYIIIMRL